MRRKAPDRVRALAQILAAFGQIVMRSLAFEVQQIGNQAHRPLGANCGEGCARRSPRARRVFLTCAQAGSRTRPAMSTALMLEILVFSSAFPGVCTGGSRRAPRPVNSTAPRRSSVAGFPLCLDRCVRNSRSNVDCGPCCHVRIRTVLDQPTGRH